MGDTPGRRDDPRDEALASTALADPLSDTLLGPSATRDDTAVEDYGVGYVLAGRYRIHGLLGRGGMGEVYRADDLVLGEQVAIKFLPRSVAADPKSMARFVQEVRVARQITHPNVCRVHDIGEADGRRFLSMEYIDGEDIASLLRRIGRLPQEKCSELAQQLCAGMAALHERGVLHRDLKPANLMVDGKGRLRLTDFGLAIAARGIRADELRDGTPAYMAPEQIAGREVTVQSDIYAIGLVLHELVAGVHPHDPRHAASVPRGAVAPELSAFVKDVDPSYAAVVRQCLAEDPQLRPPSVQAVAAALPGGDPLAAAVAAGQTPSPDTVANARAVGGLSQRVAIALLAFVLVALAGVAAFAPSGTAIGRAQPELEPAVLMHRAREILDAVGQPRGLDRWAEIRVDRGYLSAIGEDDTHAPPLSTDSPAGLRMHVRESPGDLLPFGARVGMNDPPLASSGGSALVIDFRGDLRRLVVQPPERLPEQIGAADWFALLELTGVDPASLAEATPHLMPEVFADEHRAWRGALAHGDVPVHIEAATLRGQPVWLDVVPSWEPEYEPLAEPRERGGRTLADWLFALMLAAFIVGVIISSRRTLLRNEADQRGAIRVAVGTAALYATQEFVIGHHGGPLVELRLFGMTMAFAVAYAALAFVCYVVIEPYARRFFPASMIAWTRLLYGRWRDPMVGRDTLVGAAAGLGMVWLAAAQQLAVGEPMTLRFANTLMGGRQLLGTIPLASFSAIMGILQLFVMLLLLRAVLRSVKVALVLTVLFASAANLQLVRTTDITVLVVVAAMGISMVLVMIRFGLLAAIVAQLTVTFGVAFPITVDIDRWWFGSGAFGVAVLVGMAAWGYRTATTVAPAGARTSASPA